MKIQCPNCKHEANVPEDKIPASGITASCPKCKTKFKVEREQPPSAQKSNIYCPKCGMNQPLAEICIKCGVVFSKFISAQSHRSEQKAKEQKIVKVESGPSMDDEQIKDDSTDAGEKEKPVPKKQLSKSDKRNLWVLGLLSFGLLGSLNWFAPVAFWVFTSYFLLKKGETKRNSLSMGCGAAFIIIFILGPLAGDSKKTSNSDNQPKVASKNEVVLAEPQKPSPVQTDTVNVAKSDVDIEKLKYFANETAVQLLVYSSASFECLRYLFFKEYSIDKSLIDESFRLYENQKEKLIQYRSEIQMYRDDIGYVDSYIDFIVAYDDIFSSAKFIVSDGRSPDKELILDAARKILNYANECSNLFDDTLLDDDSSGSYEIFLNYLKRYAVDVKSMEIYLDPNRTKDDTQIVVGQYGFNEHYIEHLTDKEKESFIDQFSFEYNYNVEYYRNIKGIRFITNIGDKSNDVVSVSSKVMLYDGTTQRWRETYYCGLNKYTFNSLFVSDLNYNQLDNSFGRDTAPKNLNLFEKMIYGIVCE